MYDTWFCFSPVKNNFEEATNLLSKGLPSYGAAEAEHNFYLWTNKMLKLAGVEIDEEEDVSEGMQFPFGQKILMDPTFAITLQELKGKFKGKCSISKKASVIM